ncbi:MAG: hypothetical protein ACYDC1_21960 [Limisphaerales bacterium]
MLIDMMAELTSNRKLEELLGEVAPKLRECLGKMPCRGVTVQNLMIQSAPRDVQLASRTINKRLAVMIAAVQLGQRHAVGMGTALTLTEAPPMRRLPLSSTWRVDRETLEARYRGELAKASGGVVAGRGYMTAIKSRVNQLHPGLAQHSACFDALLYYMAGYLSASALPSTSSVNLPLPKTRGAVAPTTKPSVELHGYKQTAANQKIKGVDCEGAKLRAEFDKRLLQPITLTEQDKRELRELGEDPNDPFWTT